MSTNNTEQTGDSKVVEAAYNVAAMTGQFWGNIWAGIINFSSDYANVTYNCAKLVKENFKSEVDPAVENMMNKMKESSGTDVDSTNDENN